MLILALPDHQNSAIRSTSLTIRELSGRGEAHGPTRILSALTDAGHMAGHRGQQLGRALTAVTTVVAHPEALHAYTGDVLTAALRRTFRTIAETNLEAADTTPTSDLFSLYYDGGRQLRALENRIASHRDGGQQE